MYFDISLLSPLEIGRGPLFEQTWIPFTQGCFGPILVEIGPVILEKKMKMWKVYRQTNSRTDERLLKKLTWFFSSDRRIKKNTHDIFGTNFTRMICVGRKWLYRYVYARSVRTVIQMRSNGDSWQESNFLGIIF